MEKYIFSSVPMEYVLENPELYIIPELLGLCQILWNNGIDTVQCSNYEERETTYWIEIDERTLSDENRKYVYKMLDNKHPNFGEDIRFHHPVITVDRTKEGLLLLEQLVKSFSYQDTTRYITEEDLIERYKRHGGKIEILPDGSIRSVFNPERENATIEDALKEVDTSLYVEEEGRLYADQRALDVHINYLNKLNKGRQQLVKTLKLINKQKNTNN
jgi:hypothetical protein